MIERCRDFHDRPTRSFSDYLIEMRAWYLKGFEDGRR